MRKRVISSGPRSSLERQWGQAELVLACMGMVVGGFALRVGKYHEIVIVSLIFALLGGIHLWRSRPRDPDLPFSAQRLYHRLHSSIPNEYTYYPSLREPTQPTDPLARDLLVGPWGIGVLARFDFRGTLDDAGEETWTFRTVEEEDNDSIDNPLRTNREFIHVLREGFDDYGFDPSTIPFQSYLVLMKNNIEGTALKHESVVFMHELPEAIQSQDLAHPDEDRRRQWENTVKTLITSSDIQTYHK